jgi:arylsulfatase A-like enzyme
MPAPNIVMICADDIGFNEIGIYQGSGMPDRDVYKGEHVHTPNIDSIGREGAVLTRHYTTSAICTPSRYTILTGRLASRSPGLIEKCPPPGPATITWNTPIDRSEGTIGKVFKTLGYKTGFVGKWHNGEPKVDLSSIKSIENPRDARLAAVVKAAYEEQLNHLRNGFGFDCVDRVYFGNREGFPDALQSHNLEWLAEGAEQFIQENRAQPFYLHFALSTPHGDYSTPFLTDDPLLTPGGALKNRPVTRMPPREKLLERMKAAGVSETTAMSAWQDDCVGAVLACLKECGVSENTIVVFTGDHLGRGKYMCYEGCRVPFLVRWPKQIKAGRCVDALTAHLDLVSTLTELAGGRAPADYQTDGVSFAKLLTGPQADELGRDHVFLECSNIRGIVTERWKYIACRASKEVLAAIDADRMEAAATGRKRWVAWDGKKNPHPQFATEGVRYFDCGAFPNYFDPDQLYDLQADVLERNNLAGNLEYIEVVAKLKLLLAEELRKLPHSFGEFTPAQ